MASNPVVSREVLVGQIVIDAGDLHGTRQPGEGAGDQHGDDQRPADADPGVAGRPLTLPDGPDLIPEGRSPEQKREHRRRHERHEEPGVGPVDGGRQAKDDGIVVREQRGEFGGPADRGRLRVAVRELERAADDQKPQKPLRDEVEHDGRDDFMRTSRGFQHPDHAAPQGARRRAR